MAFVLWTSIPLPTVVASPAVAIRPAVAALVMPPAAAPLPVKKVPAAALVATPVRVPDHANNVVKPAGFGEAPKKAIASH